MSNPVDIKIARINKSEDTGKSIDKDKVHEVFQRNINEKLKSFYRLQQDWVNRAYKNFNDFDTYLILMYLMNKVYVNYSDRFHYMSMDAFYGQEKVGIEKLNLIDEKISLDGKKVILVPFFLVFPIFFKGFTEFPSLNLISSSSYLLNKKL